MTARAAKRQPFAAKPSVAQESSPRPLVTLVLSAGAPNALLTAGVLYEVWRAGKTFDIIYTSGGSAFLGLVYVAPRSGRPDEALHGLIDLLGLSDVIFRLFPMNYKVFTKAGPFTEPIRRFADCFKIPPPHHHHDRARFRTPMTLFAERLAARQRGNGSFRRLYNDLVDMWAALITPTTVNPWSTGICDPFPFLDEVVDFDAIKHYPDDFYMNAYNVTRGGMDLFNKSQIDRRHFLAALAYPFMYPPVEIDGSVYFEGADFDPVSFGNLIPTKVQRLESVETLVLIDILGSLGRDIIRVPKDLWDAYGMSIMVPAVSLADKCIKLFEKENDAKDPTKEKKFKIVPITFDIGADHRANIMDWSHSNLSYLFHVGREAGRKFLHDHPDIILKDHGRIPPDRVD